MVCGEVRAQLLALEFTPAPEVTEHLSACPDCARVAEALVRLDSALRAELLANPPESLQTSVASLPSRDASLRLDGALKSVLLPEPAPAVQARLAALPDKLRLDDAMRAALITTPDAKLEARLAALAPAPVSADRRAEAAVRRGVVVPPPAILQAELAALVPEPQPDGLDWLAATWRRLWQRPAVLAAQLAAVAVLGYVLAQLLAWVGTLPVVVGDVPYALELLVLSPAMDYLGQLETLVQQLALWLLVGAAGWILLQVLPLSRQPEP